MQERNADTGPLTRRGVLLPNYSVLGCGVLEGGCIDSISLGSSCMESDKLDADADMQHLKIEKSMEKQLPCSLLKLHVGCKLLR